MSVENRIAKLDAIAEKEDNVEQNRDILNNLKMKMKLEPIIHHKQDDIYQAFRKKLIDLCWYGRKRDFRIVVFAERIETLKALKTKLQRDFDLDDSVIADYLKKYKINEELFTLEITDEEIKQLELLLPDVIKFAHQLHMD